MKKIKSALFRHSILVVAESNMLAPLEQLLDGSSLKIETCNDFAEALKMVDRCLPHLIFATALIGKKTSKQLQEALRKRVGFRKVPIFVYLDSSDHKSLSSIQGAKFAGLFNTETRPKAFQHKLRDVIQRDLSPPPYFFNFAGTGFPPEAVGVFQGELIGRFKKFVLMKSKVRASLSHPMKIRLNKQGVDSGNVRCFQNFDYQGEYISLFNLDRCFDQFRAVAEKLNPLSFRADSLGEALVKPRSRHVLVYHPEKKKFIKLESLLKKSSVRAIHANTIEEVKDHFMQAPERYSCIYLDRFFSLDDKKGWVKQYFDQPDQRRPHLFVATMDTPPPSGGTVTFVQKPMTDADLVGMIINVIDAPQNKAQTIDFVGDKVEMDSEPVTFDIPVNIQGLDQFGGVLECGVEVLTPTRVELKHEELSRFWQGKTALRLKSSILDFGESWLLGFTASMSEDLGIAEYWPTVRDLCRPSDAESTEGEQEASRATVDAEMINIFVQSIFETLEYYLDELPAMGHPKKKEKDDHLSHYISGMTMISGQSLEGYISIACDQQFISFLAYRILGVPEKMVKKDPSLMKEAMREICDQIFGKGRFYVKANGYSVDVALPKVALGNPSVPLSKKGNIMLVPFSLKDTKLVLEVSFVNQ